MIEDIFVVTKAIEENESMALKMEQSAKEAAQRRGFFFPPIVSPLASTEGTDFGQSRFGHPDLNSFGQCIFGHRGFGPANFVWPIHFLPIHVWPIHFGIWCRCHGPKRWAQTQKKSGPKGGAPKATKFALVVSLFGVFSMFFGGVSKRRGRQMFTFASSGVVM